MLRQDLKHKFMGLNGKYVCTFAFHAPQGEFPIDTYHNCEKLEDVYMFLLAGILDFSTAIGNSPFDILAQIAADIKHLENHGVLVEEHYPIGKKRRHDNRKE